MQNKNKTIGNAVHPLNFHSGAVLKAMFRGATRGANSYDGVCAGVMGVVASLSRNCGQVGFVSAIIGSDGPQLVDRNMAILADYTDRFRNSTSYPVISAADVFHMELLDQYRSVPNSANGWFGFWRKVLGSGVSDLFMTPRWTESAGAMDEHEFARETKIRIHYRESDPELVRILARHRGMGLFKRGPGGKG
ncbi:MAG: hypothetical protein KGH94_02005 [Candidatus Micrarchaeota archaeon]|nr:hypothetical protein [Candidatus Micrarchaeota archaeon]